MNIIQDHIHHGRRNRPGVAMTPKRCAKCHTEKPTDQYYRQARKADGLHPWCKLCCQKRRAERRPEINARDRERRATDPRFREMRRCLKRQWEDRNREHKRTKEKQRRALHPEEYATRRAAYAAAHPEMMRVLAATRQRVYLAIKQGRLTRPSACEECGTECKPEAAHHDYSKPLDVRWLCRSCHTRWDYHEPKYRGRVVAQ